MIQETTRLAGPPTAPELWLLDDARIMGGGQLFTLRLARHVMRERGAGRVRVVCPAASDLGRRAQAAGLRVEDFACPAPAALPAVWRAGRRLRARLRSAPGAVVVACSARCQAVAVAAGCDERLVHLMLERDSAGRASVRFVQARRGRVVAVGANAAQAYGSAALHNFLLDEEFDRLAAAPAPPRDGTLGVLARLIPEKGVLELVRELDGAAGWSRLLVAGELQDPGYAAAVRAAAGPRVELLGRVADVPAFFGRADVVLVPSVGHEGQPTVIIEALAAGRPVVVRAPVYSPDYDGLPVFPYGDLGDALAAARAAPPPDAALLRARFGAAQALVAIEGAPA
jgi:glycosyltransferase involved in cell wall biosynthesis